MFRLGFVILLLICRSKIVYNGLFWVSENGESQWEDCSTLSEDRPLSGLDACSLYTSQENAKAGDKVFFRSGLYSSSDFKVKNNGTDWENPILFKSYKNELVVIFERTLIISNIKYIIFNGINVDANNQKNSGILLDNRPEHIIIKSFTMQNIKHPTVDGGTGIWIRSTEFSGGANDIMIEDFEIFNVCEGCDENSQAGSGIHIWGNNLNPTSNIVIKNCRIYDVHTEDAIHIGVFGWLVENVTIENCVMWNNKENAIDIKRGRNIIIRNVEVFNHVSSPTSSGAGIVMHMGAQNIIIENSIFYQNEQGVNVHWNCGSCPFSDNNVTNITIKNSFFFNNSNFGIFIGDNDIGHVSDMKVLHNTIVRNPNIGLYVYNNIDGVAIYNNVFQNNTERDLVYNRYNTLTFVEADFNMFPFGGKIYKNGQVLNIDEFKQTTTETDWNSGNFGKVFSGSNYRFTPEHRNAVLY